MQWPADGRLTRAEGEAKGATIVFLHHFGGKRSSTRRHQDLVTKLGYDAFAYTLSAHGTDFAPFRADLIGTWARELETVLNALPGKKIIYSLSFPSMTVACLLGERDRPDVRAWICDGGPFAHVGRCMWNYFAHAASDEPVWRRAARTAASYALVGGPMYAARADRWIGRLRPKFPVLSLRSADDRLVPADAIDRVFAAPHRLDVTTHEFPAAAHLGGILTAQAEYVRVLKRFLAHVKI